MKRLVAGLVVLGFLAGCGGTTTVTQHSASPPGKPLPNVSGHEGNAARGQCGVERWAVKTLSDPAAGDVNPTPVETSIAALITQPTPANPTDRVPGIETTTYQLRGVHISGFKQEADSDLHLVIDQGGAHMIVEIPDPACMAGAASSVIAAVSASRASFLARFGPASDRFTNLDATISVQGVGFFDRIHGQRGVAPNGIELHPVLADS